MILVTGATGMIGRAVVARLLADGFEVRATGRSAESLDKTCSDSSKLRTAVADFEYLDKEAARKLTDGCTAIVHCAGLVHQPKANNALYDRLNVEASKLLARAAKENELQQFIFLSSSSVYGNRSTEMIAESAELHGDTPYAASKIATERDLQSTPPAPSTVILRPSLVFGTGDRGNMLSLIRQVLSGKYFIVGDGNASKSLIFANDLAAAISTLLKKPTQGCAVFNIANQDPVTVKQLSEAILKADEKDPAVPSVAPWFIQTAATAANLILGSRSPLSADRLAKLTRNNSVSTTAFHSQFPFKETDLRTALQQEITWARKSNLL